MSRWIPLESNPEVRMPFSFFILSYRNDRCWTQYGLPNHFKTCHNSTFDSGPIKLVWTKKNYNSAISTGSMKRSGTWLFSSMLDWRGYSALQLLDMVSKPVKAVLLLFPISKTLEAKRREEDDLIRSEASSPSLFSSVIWIKQTVCTLAYRCSSSPVIIHVHRSLTLVGQLDCCMP